MTWILQSRPLAAARLPLPLCSLLHRYQIMMRSHFIATTTALVMRSAIFAQSWFDTTGGAVEAIYGTP